MQKILFIIAIFSSFWANAQDHPQDESGTIWKDYIIGKPMAGYGDAKIATAKEWGIQYQPIFAGCIISEEVENTRRMHDDNNSVYLKTLADKFGADWMHYFNLDVQKKMNILQAEHEKGVWIDPVLGKPYMAHFEAKEAVAKKWGIHYKTQFLGCKVSDESKAEMEKSLEASNAYLARLAARFGENWEEDFNREVKFELAKNQLKTEAQAENSPAKNEIWVDCVMGKPNTSYFDAKKAVAQAWGIAYKTNFMGCKRTPKLIEQRNKIDAQNKKYFAAIEKQYGADWRTHFDRAVQKEIAKNQLKNEEKTEE